jgi:FAD/FMN-containing dehydrogenase
MNGSQKAGMLTETLKEIVGEGGWTSDPAELEPHLTEWRDRWRGETLIMVSPDTTGKVAAVVSACRDARVGIVPQGGNTGLCGGAIPDSSGQQVLLSLSRMNRIRKIAPDDHSIVVEAGCTLASVQQAAADAGRSFPLSLAAEGSCQIGGNLSTNAGGINVLRFGTARDQALGLEVVLADGAVWDGLKSLRKDTAGYDLKQLFIGSEGTLGIITAAALRLYPPMDHTETALVALDSPARAVALLSELRYKLNDQLVAFELIPDRALRYVERHIDGCRAPLGSASPWFALIETASAFAGDGLQQALGQALACDTISDAVVAQSHSQRDELWRLRHGISEAQKREGASLKHDISVPVGAVAQFIDTATNAVMAAAPGTRVVAFGHVGDGNIHFNLSQPRDADSAAFLAKRSALQRIVHDVAVDLGGSVSAEHGVGQAKREELLHYKSETEITLMRRLKTALDPDGILNPGKVI